MKSNYIIKFRNKNMSNITKQNILEAIQRTAKENGGVPLGRERFEKETGIKPYDFGKYWAKFSVVA